VERCPIKNVMRFPIFVKKDSSSGEVNSEAFIYHQKTLIAWSAFAVLSFRAYTRPYGISRSFLIIRNSNSPISAHHFPLDKMVSQPMTVNRLIRKAFFLLPSTFFLIKENYPYFCAWKEEMN
ncbi:MAG: hypothetical protein AAF598_05035, partial [Bacteroidota bacterium]